MESLDLLANNVANASTGGYKPTANSTASYRARPAAAIRTPPCR
jgi:flagellar basal body rod protein FlgG